LNRKQNTGLDVNYFHYTVEYSWTTHDSGKLEIMNTRTDKQLRIHTDLKVNKKLWISWRNIVHFNNIGPQYKLQT